MTSGQQVQLLHIVDLGLKWAAGEISFKDVKQRLGKPNLISNEDEASEIECMYFQDGMVIDFVFNKLRLRNGHPEESYFRLSVSESVHTNIRKETLDNLGLYRIGSGDSNDGVRTETGEFMNWFGSMPGGDVNRVLFAYWLPIRADSPFEVHVDATYEGKLDQRDTWPDLKSLMEAVDLRKIEIYRRYPTAE